MVAKAARQAAAACRGRAGRPGGNRRSVSAAADPMQIQRGKKVIAPCQILEKKKEKRKNLNCSIIKWLMFGVPFLR